MRRLIAGVLLAAATLSASRAGAQDFATTIVSPTAAPGAAAMLESGLPPRAPSANLEFAAIRWHGLVELTTRAAAGSIGWGLLRVAAGLSQTGEPDVGWTALGAALGVADSEGGAAVRAVARRDRTSNFGFDDRGAAVGVEIGGGARVSVGPRLDLWASAPQLWTRGEAPPEARALAIGGTARFKGLALWLAREAVPGFPAGGRGEHAAGIGTGSGPLAIALTVRDQPLRGGLALAARTAGIGIAGAVEGHPVLGETIRLALTVGGGR